MKCYRNEVNSLQQTRQGSALLRQLLRTRIVVMMMMMMMLMMFVSRVASVSVACHELLQT